MNVGYVGLEVSDRASLETLFENVFGLVAGEPTAAGATTWRNDDKAQRIILHDGSTNDAAYLGLEYDESEFGGAVDRLRAFGATVTEGSAAELEQRRVSALVHTQAPWGPRIELVTGLELARSPFESALVPSGFLTGSQGFGHAVFQVKTMEQLDEVHRFATEALAFTQSDWFESGPDAGGVVAHFYHCNARHHTLAVGYTSAGIVRASNHIMLETNDIDDVGAAYDRALQAGVVIDRGLGRHDNDRMFSFYAQSPAGSRFEFGAGARSIVEPWTENRRYDRGSVWGHHTSPV
jgi:2,3-dihydroxybiphenyl 1,2-dioxygenase